MAIAFDWIELPPELRELRAEVREFLAAERAAGSFEPCTNSWIVYDRAFSLKCGERGWIGMTWPNRYGGGERSVLAQNVVTEELLAAGAPVSAHWMADRQIGPQILRFGSEAAKREILPRIARGEVTFALGMSEPNSGSDLGSVRTAAKRVEGGWEITGAKIWTTNAHQADYMNVLARSAPLGEDRRAGLSQFIVALPDPKVDVTPILNMAGRHEFNEVRFDGCFVPDERVVGEVGQGWKVVTDELALERSGPDRLMSSYDLLRRLADEVGPEPDRFAAVGLGRLVAQLATLRHLSRSVAGMLEAGRSPVGEAALVKDLGNLHEQAVPEAARQLVPSLPSLSSEDGFQRSLAETLLHAPSFTIRGGTTEILRGLAARYLS